MVDNREFFEWYQGRSFEEQGSARGDARGWKRLEVEVRYAP